MKRFDLVFNEHFSGGGIGSVDNGKYVLHSEAVPRKKIEAISEYLLLNKANSDWKVLRNELEQLLGGNL